MGQGEGSFSKTLITCQKKKKKGKQQQQKPDMKNNIDLVLFSFQFMQQILHQLTMFFEIHREE